MIVHGSHGAGGCYLTPQELMDKYSGKNAPPQKYPRVKNHMFDWVNSITSGHLAGSDFSYGGPLTQSALLGVIALKYPGQRLEWDDKAVRFTNHEEANAFLNPPYREGWRL